MKKTSHPMMATADMPDVRDYIYVPALLDLAKGITPPEAPLILDQGQEGACTGFALAATINHLNRLRGEGIVVSPRMLYEMARLNDEWPGEDYDGSSLRGAIRGWKNMGVCSEEKFPYVAGETGGLLTIEAAKEARSQTVGAYFRIRPVISHFHAALNEAGVIAVSARVHSGWNHPGRKGEIKLKPELTGGHAFAVVGYDDKGFWVQNSWGTDWGRDGLARWSYEDWIENVMDAWVVRLALPTPQIFGRFPGAAKIPGDSLSEEAPGVSGKAAGSTPRSAIAGHFVHIDDGRYHQNGSYWSNRADVEQTARLVADSDKYPHFVLYVHGGLNAPKASAARIAAMKDGFKRNGVYPYHLMYDTGLAEELRDLIWSKGKTSAERVGAFSDFTDRFLEGLLRRPGTLVWEEMKDDAAIAFTGDGAGTDTLRLFIKHFRQAAKAGRKTKIHLVGHSTGAVVIAHLLRVLQNTQVTIESCSLMAPAVTLDLYHSHYLPILRGEKKLSLSKLAVYSLMDAVERDDTVSPLYRKSLLYLVSNAFERQKGRPLLGMEKFHKDVRKAGGMPVFHLSDGASGSVTRSKTHGGFDNDAFTMNHILRRILGKKPRDPFTVAELARF